LGNFFTVRDLLDQGVPGEVIRMVMLGTHYRKPMDWTEKRREEAEKTLRRWYVLVSENVENVDPPAELIAALSDDLNTKAALDVAHKASLKEDVASLKACMKMLGLLEPGMGDWTKPRASTEPVQIAIGKILDAWFKARSEKDFETADAIRDRAASIGILLQVNPDKTPKVVFKSLGMTQDQYLRALQTLLEGVL
jgi:cysteinyl-tRNA synthetase